MGKIRTKLMEGEEIDTFCFIVSFEKIFLGDDFGVGLVGCYNVAGRACPSRNSKWSKLWLEV